VFHDVHILKKCLAKYKFVGEKNVIELLDPKYLEVKKFRLDI